MSWLNHKVESLTSFDSILRREQTLIGLAGPIGSGKTVIGRFLEDRCGFVYKRYSLLLRQQLEEQGSVIDDDTMQEYGQRVFQLMGGQGLSELIMQDYDPSKNYVIDGLRHMSDYDYFQKRFGNRFHLIYVQADEGLRLERYLLRGTDRANSLDSFYRRISHEVEREVPLLINKASAIIVNTDLAPTLSQVNGLVGSWLYNRQLRSLQEMVEAVTAFHKKHGFPINTADNQVMYYRMGLLIEELGEINECLSKGRGDIGEEHADLLILLIGNAITLGLDIETEFWKKFDRIMKRKGKQVGESIRVSAWEQVEEHIEQVYDTMQYLRFLMRREEDANRESNHRQLKLFDV
jgi:dephospho-CoA kinase/NTP pyrophosphatase (non-canonical NTP hydrolase)